MAKKKKETGAFKTLAFADKHKIDKETRTSTPSIEQVEETRDWSKENKK